MAHAPYAGPRPGLPARPDAPGSAAHGRHRAGGTAVDNLLATDAALATGADYLRTAARRHAWPALDGDTRCDVAIVGGGLAGLSAAIELRERGLDVLLLEARQVGSGASGRNGGQAIAGLACDQSTVEAQLGLDDARRVWQTTLDAIDLIAARSARFGIDCDWQPGFLSVAVNDRKAAALRRWAQTMQARYGHATTWIDRRDLPGWIASPRYAAGLHDARSGHLHPLKYTLGLAAAAHGLGVRIHEQTTVTGLVPGAPLRLQTATGTVTAAQVLLAGNVYLQRLCPALQARIMPVGTYIVASERLAPELAAALIPSRSAVCDTNFVLDYFRLSADDRLLYGGRVSYSTATPPGLAAAMQRRMAATFPALRDTAVAATWGGFVDITLNRAPDFGRLDAVLPLEPAWRQVYYLQGFSGHGLALTGMAGQLVAEAMTGDAARFDVFARLKHRAFPGGTLLRTPALLLASAYQRLRDLL